MVKLKFGIHIIGEQKGKNLINSLKFDEIFYSVEYFSKGDNKEILDYPSGIERGDKSRELW